MTSVSKEELKKYVSDYLEKNRLMTLATSEKDIPWAATVFFAYDPDLNIYFISRPETRKTKHLHVNPNVSVAVNHHQSKSGLVKGVQLEGTAKILDKNKDVKELEIFKKRHNWAEKYLHNHELFKITPKKVYYLDDELFGPGGRGVFEAVSLASEPKL